MKKYFLIVVMFLFAGCASVPIYTYRIPKPKSFETADIVAVIASTLQDNGFNLNLVNDKIGIVSTEFMSLTSNSKKNFDKVMWGAANSRRIKISFSIDQNIKVIKMSPVIENTTETVYGAGTPGACAMKEKEKNKVMKIMKEISSKLSIDESQIEVIQEVCE